MKSIDTRIIKGAVALLGPCLYSIPFCHRPLGLGHIYDIGFGRIGAYGNAQHTHYFGILSIAQAEYA